MSRYVKENLVEDEEVIMEAKVSYLCIIPKILSVLLGLGILVVYFSALSNGVFSWFDEYFGENDLLYIMLFLIPFASIGAMLIIFNIAGIFSLLNMHLIVTNKRILGKIGVFSIKAVDYPIEKIDSVSLSAGFFGKLFGYYSLSIRSVGSGSAKGGIRFNGVRNALEFKNHITIAMERHSHDARILQAEEIAKALEKAPLF